MMVIVAPNSHAHKGKKERGEVKGEYERVCEEEKIFFFFKSEKMHKSFLMTFCYIG